MNNKIPVRQFAEKLATECGVSSDEAQQFVKIYFEKVIERLRSGENVELPGLGSFNLTHNSDCPVSFEPDADAAAEINSPFEMFEPTELAEGISEEDLSEEASAETEAVLENDEPEDAPITEIGEEKVEEQIQSDTEELAQPEQTELQHDDTAEEPVTDIVELTAEENNADETEQPVLPSEVVSEDKYSGYIPEDEEEYVVHQPVAKNGASFGLGFLIGILTGLIIGAVVLYVYAMYYVNTPVGM